MLVTGHARLARGRTPWPRAVAPRRMPCSATPTSRWGVSRKPSSPTPRRSLSIRRILSCKIACALPGCARKTAASAKNLDCLPVIVKRLAMRLPFPCVAILAGSLLGLAAQAVAAPKPAPSEDRRLVVIEAPGSALSKTTRERLRGAIAEVVGRHGLVLAPSDTLPEKLLGCDLPGCLAPIAAASGAIFVLRVDARFAKESFKLTVELWHSDEGRLLGRDRRDCPICDEQDLWGSAALLTQGLLERALREPVKTAQVLVPGAGAAPVAGPATSPEVAQIRSEPTGRVAKVSGLALSVAGLAALVAGVYYLSVDGDSAGFHSDRVRDTGKYGLPMAIAGGVALVS